MYLIFSNNTFSFKKKHNSIYYAYSVKVQLFWEGHKNVRNRPYVFEIYLVNVKTMRTIAQIFVAFSEKLNCKYKNSI